MTAAQGKLGDTWGKSDRRAFVIAVLVERCTEQNVIADGLVLNPRILCSVRNTFIDVIGHAAGAVLIVIP